MSASNTDIKKLIIDALNLEDVSIEEIEDSMPLFGEGLGLDSIDALELGVAIKKKYNITLESDNSETKQHFATVESLTAFINSQINK